MFPTLKQRLYKGMRMSFRTFLKREVKEEMERLKPKELFLQGSLWGEART